MSEKDFVFVSFPCSGRHWIARFFESYLVDTDKPISGLVYDLEMGKMQYLKQHGMLDINFTHGTQDGDWQDIFTYKDMERVLDESMYKDKTCIHLVRDPRDVIVSYYHQKQYREPWLVKQKISEFIPPKMDFEDFIWSPVYGIPKIVAYMNSWAKVVEPYICYESMQDNMFDAMTLLLNLMEIPVRPTWLKHSIWECSFDQMKDRERRDDKEVYADPGNENTKKMRVGKVGGYKKFISEGSIEKINAYLKGNLHKKWQIYF